MADRRLNLSLATRSALRFHGLEGLAAVADGLEAFQSGDDEDDRWCRWVAHVIRAAVSVDYTIGADARVQIGELWHAVDEALSPRPGSRVRFVVGDDERMHVELVTVDGKRYSGTLGRLNGEERTE